jgi:hypothetical protein
MKDIVDDGRAAWWLTRVFAGVLLIAMLVVVGAAVARPGYAQDDDDDDDENTRTRPTIEITVSPEQAAPGGDLSYTIRVRAPREVAAQRIRVLLLFNPGQLEPRTTRFEDSDDWVSSRSEDALIVTFGPFRADEQRRGTIVFRVNPNLANYTTISVRARYDWLAVAGPSATATPTPTPNDDDDEDNRPNIRVEVPEVTVLSPNAPPPRAEVWPTSAPAGTAFQFHALNFAPGEAYVTWLNTPDGVRELPIRGTATASGEVWLGLESSGFRPGAYSIVIFGLRSQRAAVGPFIVQ